MKINKKSSWNRVYTFNNIGFMVNSERFGNCALYYFSISYDGVSCNLQKLYDLISLGLFASGVAASYAMFISYKNKENDMA
jgi:hypothetical protein